ncbi:MAG: SDR family NAD(P)-dependent oxidoreductase [Pseudomonadota bacterium]
MDPFPKGGVAVVTGAASGIGRAAAKRLAEMEMRLALVDLPGPKLDAAAAETGAMAIAADLSEPASIAMIRDRVLADLGAPAFLMNNAGAREGRTWEGDRALWRKLMEVNFWAVASACDAFLPAMGEAGGVIVNTGSKQGITNPPGTPIYNVSKSAVKTYTEALEHKLRGRDGPRVSAHLLIPGWTTVGDADHKPGAWLPEQVVEMMIAGVRVGDFHILCPDDETTPEMDRKRILWAAGDLTESRPPLSRWHPDWKARAAKACS